MRYLLTSRAWMGVALIVLALLLRLPLLNSSFWLDEAAQATEIARPWYQQLEIAGDFQPPLLHIWSFLAIQLGESEWWLRLWGAVVPGLITIYLTWKIGRRQGPWVGEIAGLLLATHSFHIYYSQELRPYALPALFVTLSWWVLLEATHNKKWQWWPVWYAVAVVGSLYSSYVTPFALVAQGLWWSWWCYQEGEFGLWKKWILASGAGVACFVPWLPFLREQMSVAGSLQSQLPGWSEVVGFGLVKNLGLLLGKLLFGVSDLELSGWFVGWLGVLAILKFWWLWKFWPHLNKKFIRTQLPYWAWLGGSVLLAVVVSLYLPILQPKRLLFLWPAWTLGITSCLVQSARVDGVRRVSWVFGICLLVLNLAGIAAYWRTPELQREPWREAIVAIQGRYPQDETVIIQAFSEPFAPWVWYERFGYRTLVTGEFVASDERVRELLKTAETERYVIVFEYLTDLTDPQDLILTTLDAYGYREVQVENYPLLGAVRVYTKKVLITS